MIFEYEYAGRVFAVASSPGGTVSVSVLVGRSLTEDEWRQVMESLGLTRREKPPTVNG